jgi:glycosyltransferase involved in cell wall biosynthesis
MNAGRKRDTSSSTGASVLIRAHLDSPYLLEALISVAQQTTQYNVEILLGLDRPTQVLMNQIERFKAEYPSTTIQLFELSSVGIATRLNSLASESNYDFICILDSDDRMLSDRIEFQVNFLIDNPQCAAVGSAISIINQDGDKVGEKGFSTDMESIRRNKYSQLPLAHPATSIRKSALESVGGYRDFFFPSEDYDLWLRLLERYSLANSSKILTEYRIHPAQATAAKYFRNYAAAIAAETSSKYKTSGKKETVQSFKDPQEWARHSSQLPRITWLAIKAALWQNGKKKFDSRNYLEVTIIALLIILISPISGRKEIFAKLRNKKLFF